jgi:hypothetical protein
MASAPVRILHAVLSGGLAMCEARQPNQSPRAAGANGGKTEEGSVVDKKGALPGIAWVAAGAARRITKRSSGESGSSNLARRSADPVVEGLRVYDGNTAARVAAT